MGSDNQQNQSAASASTDTDSEWDFLQYHGIQSWQPPAVEPTFSRHDSRSYVPEYSIPTNLEPLNYVYSNEPSSNVSATTAPTQAKTTSDSVRSPSPVRHETLGPEYQEVFKPRSFFKIGRIFKTPWPEPAKGPTSNVKAISRIMFGEYCFTEIRWFVVVSEHNHHSICVPMHTYSGSGTLKRGLSPQDHAIIHVRGMPPEQTLNEKLDRLPFAFDPVTAEHKISSASRINFAKAYSVEHFVKVCNVGKIVQEHLPRLERYFLDSMSFSKPEKPSRSKSGGVELSNSDVDETGRKSDSETREATPTIQNAISNVQTRMMSMRIDDDLKRIQQWLSAPNPSLNYENAYKTRTPSTGTWFLSSKQFNDWKTNSDSLLWLQGIPGCGKTILSSTIIHDVLGHCQRQENFATSYFYFDFNDTEKGSSGTMLRSLISQLSTQTAGTSLALKSLFSSYDNGRQLPRVSELLDTLRLMVGEFKETFVILDALDECEDKQELSKSLEEMKGWNRRLHILITSRTGTDIDRLFAPTVNGRETFCIDSAQIKDDIRTYIRSRLKKNRNLERWKTLPQVQLEIETTLSAKANGMFRWVVYQVDSLEGSLNLRILRKTLASLPRTLDETYARILDNMDAENNALALKVLRWLIYCARPLRLEEASEAITVDFVGYPRVNPEKRLPEPRDILTICSGLVTTAEIVPTTGVSGDSGKPVEQVTLVQLVHLTVKEYLLSQSIKRVPLDRFFERTQANAEIAEDCLAYLLQFDRPDSLKPGSVENFPLAVYAATYWMEHARWAESSMSGVQIMELFRRETDAYANWIKLYNPDKPWQKPQQREQSSSDPIRDPSPLYVASLAGLTESARLLLETGADVNAREGYFGCPLQAASCKGHFQTVMVLIEHGADINARGGDFGTALQAASREGHFLTVKSLIELGADVNVQYGPYGNALQAAARGGHDDVVRILIEAGADVNAEGGYFGNALQAASREGHMLAVYLLLDHGADVNASGGVYGSALQAASIGGYKGIVQLLLDRGADVNAQGGHFGSALQAAKFGRHEDVQQILIEAGAEELVTDPRQHRGSWRDRRSGPYRRRPPRRRTGPELIESILRS